jgi:hypothetical protein
MTQPTKRAPEIGPICVIVCPCQTRQCLVRPKIICKYQMHPKPLLPSSTTLRTALSPPLSLAANQIWADMPLPFPFWRSRCCGGRGALRLHSRCSLVLGFCACVLVLAPCRCIRCSRCARAASRALFLFLFVVRSRWEMATERVGARSCINKLFFWPYLVDLASPLQASSDLHGGEGGVGGEKINTATWSTSSVAHHRPWASIPSIQIAEGWLL